MSTQLTFINSPADPNLARLPAGSFFYMYGGLWRKGASPYDIAPVSAGQTPVPTMSPATNPAAYNPTNQLTTSNYANAAPASPYPPSEYAGFQAAQTQVAPIPTITPSTAGQAIIGYDGRGQPVYGTPGMPVPTIPATQPTGLGGTVNAPVGMGDLQRYQYQQQQAATPAPKQPVPTLPATDLKTQQIATWRKAIDSALGAGWYDRFEAAHGRSPVDFYMDPRNYMWKSQSGLTGQDAVNSAMNAAIQEGTYHQDEVAEWQKLHGTQEIPQEQWDKWYNMNRNGGPHWQGVGINPYGVS